jgi:hypothetical protein
MLTYATIEELLEAVFSIQSAAAAMPYYNIPAARKGIFCAVRPKDM